jgi:AcrR family transcriptional regulator
MVLQAGKKIALTDEDKELQKQRILKAAVEVFGRNGYEKTTISQIAQEADMGRGTLYWYFKSKEDLFRHIIRAVITDLMTPIQGILEKETTLEEKLRYLIRSWLEAGVKQQGLFRIFHSIFAQSQGGFAQEMLQAMRSMYLLIIETLENMYMQAASHGQIKSSDTHRLARLTIGVVDGIILQHMLVEPVNPELMTEVIIQLMLKGLEKEGGPSA